MTQLVESLKAQGEYWKAGYIAYIFSLNRRVAYGAHYGLRRERIHARNEFARGGSDAWRDMKVPPPPALQQGEAA